MNINTSNNYENYKLLISRLQEGNPLRNSFLRIKERFILEFYKDDGIIKFLEFLNRDNEFSNYFIDRIDKKALEAMLSDEAAVGFISEQKVDISLINGIWKENSIEFIEKLHDYRSNCIADPNLAKQLMGFASKINNDSLRFIYEIIQNADDCDYEETTIPSIEINFSKSNEVKIQYNELGMSYSDIISITTIGQSNKRNRKKKRIIGEKGIGFKTIFAVCESVEIHSGSYHFSLSGDSFKPNLIDDNGYNSGTTLILKFDASIDSNENKFKIDSDSLYDEISSKFGFKTSILNKTVAFKNCPILFTNQLKKIKVIKNENENFKIEIDNFNSDNKYEFYIKYYQNNQKLKEIIEGIGFKRNIEFEYAEYKSRYPKQYTEEEYNIIINSGNITEKKPITYEIQLIAPKNPKEINEGNLYSFLPTFTNICAPFNLQLPVKLNLDRSDMYFDGELDTNKITIDKYNANLWNNRIMDEMFFNENSLIKYFYENIDDRVSYIPNFNSEKELFKSKHEKAIHSINEYCKSRNLISVFREIKYFKVYKQNLYVTVDKAIMFDEFIYNNFYEKYYNCIKKDIPFYNKEKKYLVEFNKQTEKKTKCFGFKYYEPHEEQKALYLKNVLQGKEIQVQNEIQKGVNRSIYLPETYETLKILPVLVKPGNFIYKAYNDGLIYFNKYKNLYSNDKVCFLNEDLKINGLNFEKINYSFSNFDLLNYIWAKIYPKVNPKKDNKCNQDLFIEFINLIKLIKDKSSLDWFKFLLLELNFNNEKTNKESFYIKNKIIYENLFELIDYNLDKLINNTYGTENYMKFYTLGLISFDKLLKLDDEGYFFDLPLIEDWDKTFCEGINNINYKNDLELSNKNLIKSKNSIVKELFSYLSFIKIDNIYIYDKLPIDYVKTSNFIILKRDDIKIAKQCTNEIKKGSHLVVKHQLMLKQLLNDTDIINDQDKALRVTKEIKQVCAFSHETNANKIRAKIGNDNNLLNELLQNANDRIDDGNLTIKIEKNKLVLNYHEKGFSPKDFLAISTVGNSGNIDDNKHEKDNINSIGYKGTGFKSVYNVFEKVVIENGYIKCILDDTQTIESLVYSNDLNSNIFPEIKYKKWNTEKKSFPIPQFEVLATKSNYTTFTLFFKNYDNRVFKEKNKDLFDNISECTSLYFLENIKKIKVNDKEFDKDKFIKNNFYRYQENIELSESEYKINPKFSNLKMNLSKNYKNNYLQILFPKNDKYIKLCKQLETNVYAILPIKNNNYKTNFLINCPLFELEDGRNSLASESKKINEWNNLIKGKALIFKDSVFSKIFNQFSNKYPRIAYKYFPAHCISEWKCLVDIPFIYTVNDLNNKKFKLKSLNQIYENNNGINNTNITFVFLPSFMYQWLSQIKGKINFNSNTSFVYYDKEFDHKKFLNILNRIKDDKIYDFDEFDSPIMKDIFYFFEKRFYTLRNNILEKEVELQLVCDILENSHYQKSKFFNKEIDEICFRWILGKKICNVPVHSLIDIQVNGYENITKYEEKLQEIFNNFEVYIKYEHLSNCFINIRKNLYINEANLYVVNDNFLDLVFENNKKEKIYFFNDELINLSEELITQLYEEGKIVVKTAKDRFLYSNQMSLFVSSIINNKDYLLEGPEEVEFLLDDIDDKILNMDFYYNTNFDTVNEIISDYLKDKFYHKSEILNNSLRLCKYFIENNKFENAKIIFDKIIKYSDENCRTKNIIWNNKFVKVLDTYNKQIFIDEKNIGLTTKTQLIFYDDELKPLLDNMIHQFDASISTEKKYEKFFIFNNQRTLEYIFKKYFRIYKSSFGNNQYYTIGKAYNEQKQYIIVFGEKSIRKALKELFGCDEYNNSAVFTPMNNYLPNPLFKREFDNSDISLDEIDDIEIDLKLNNEIKEYLIDRLEYFDKKENIWRCYDGYGEINYKNKKCPICNSILISEASSLRIFEILVIKGVNVSILACSNCFEAKRYSKGIYFCLKDGKKYLDLKSFKQDIIAHGKMIICFDLDTNEKKLFELNMTIKHRLYCLKQLPESV